MDTSVRSAFTFCLAFIKLGNVLRLYLFFFLVLILSNQRLIAEDVPPIPSDWTPIEQNAWKTIVSGMRVELAPHNDVPVTELRWADDQRLSASFLRTILTNPDERVYSAEPYRQLAVAFRDAGMEEKATRTLFEGKQRERHALNGFPKFLSTLSLIFTGYGYHYEYSIYWSTAFVLLGTLIFVFSKEGRNNRLKSHFSYSDLFFFSLDAFLPFVHLRDKFGDVDFTSWVRYYFYMHRMAGYVIGSFVLAALAGR